ncbi:MAG: diguanylate cyclase [Candidatus Omnitrophota bacterium]
MLKKARGSSFASRGLRVKLLVSISLLSIIPILILLNLIFPTVEWLSFGLKKNIFWVSAITIIIGLIGFFILKQIVDHIVRISADAQMIAKGDINHKIRLVRDDEIGDLGRSLDQLTQRIRGNMDELKSYSERTKEINTEIHKRVVVMSSLLQISSLITQGTELIEILKMTAEKIIQVGQSKLCFLLLRDEGSDVLTMRSIYGDASKELMSIKINFGEGVLGKLAIKNERMIVDSQMKPSAEVDAWRKSFAMVNTVVTPILRHGEVCGILGIGNDLEDFVYKPEEIEMVDIFVKQVSIAVEDGFLHHKVEKLEIKDPLTGLYNDRYILARLDEEIKRAIVYQRPCAFVIFNADDFRRYHTLFGELSSESALKKIAVIFEESASEIDRVGRIGDNEFAFVLPEKNKRQAKDMAEDVRKKIEFAFGEDTDVRKHLTVSSGVSENPIDGVTVQDLMVKARQLLSEAKAHGKNQVKA